ncbi:MAG TPA: ParB N-terminal domain-containing protein [Longimicrobiaceae bacterium]|nr:ParB N-terminal domain-containing protein [Longimicrobiaceae bacterium]
MATRPPRFDPATMKQRLRQREAQSAVPHPARAMEGPRTATDHLMLAPGEIVLEGPYVRHHVGEEELAALVQAIVAGGEIKQAIGVRVEGTPLEPRYVLVYGMRRWLASKKAGLARIPVRNHGRISAGESLALQVTENEARVDPHPVDTAVSYHLLVQEGMSQAEVARVAGRSPAHVSYMRAVGEAILQLDEAERSALYATPEATVPRFQRIAPLRSVEERAAALRALLGGNGNGAPAPRPRPATRFNAGVARGSGAWSVRVSYRDDEIRRDPELAARLEHFFEQQLQRLREQVRGSRAEPRGPVQWEIESAE